MDTYLGLTGVTTMSRYKHVVTDGVKFQPFFGVLIILFIKRQWLSTTNVTIRLTNSERALPKVSKLALFLLYHQKFQ
jgi:hypothetical protein